jgi:deoxyribonuclease V
MKDHTSNLAINLAESEQYQIELAVKVQTNDDPNFEREYVTGVDVSYKEEKAYACAVVIHIPTRTISQTKRIVVDCECMYIPEHFYLREGPVLTKLLEGLQDTGPILIDGNGILHPRRMGLASFIGVKLDKQTIGVAKSPLMGLIGDGNDNIAHILDRGEEIGAALWIGSKKKPVYVSIGHKISLSTAIEVTLAASFDNYPEPLRQAHICSKNIKE